MKLFIFLAVMALSGSALAGGGGTNNYLCSSAGLKMSVQWEGNLNTIWFVVGKTTLLVHSSVEKKTSLYVLSSFKQDGSGTRFEMNAPVGQENFGKLKVNLATSFLSLTVTPLKGSPIERRDLKCQRL